MATLKQKAVVKDLLENVGKPVSVAMLDAGYAPTTAKNPDHITESKGWAELMNEFMPDDKLAKVGQEGLDAWKMHSSHTEADTPIPDFAVRHKYWETGLKLKGRFPEKTTGVEITEGDKTIRVVVQDYK